MKSLTLTGLAAASLALAAAPAAAGDADPEALAAAFERCLTADVDAEWCALAERKNADAKARCETTGACALDCDCGTSAQVLAYHLKKSPAGWETVTPLFEASFADADRRGRALDVLAWAKGQAPARELAASLVQREPDAFSREHLLSFAEAGVEPVLAEAAERSKHDVRLTACALKAGAIDEEKGAHALRKALKKALHGPLDDERMLDAYVAAGALRRLGEEDHWSRVQARVKDEVIGALDDGAIEKARDLALGARFCVKNLREAKGYGLGYLEGRLAFHRAVGSGELSDADAVFESIEHVAKL